MSGVDMSWKCEACGASVEYDDELEAELRQVRSVLRDMYEPSCVTCGAVLVGVWDPSRELPPHCENCLTPNEEQQFEWENSRPARMAALVKALGDR